MYESPIKMLIADTEIQYEDNCIKAVQRYGIDVDKDELIKALAYDRRQYDKGYADGQRDAVVHGHWIVKDGVYGVAYCSECGYELKANDTNYCPMCGTKMDEVSE